PPPCPPRSRPSRSSSLRSLLLTRRRSGTAIAYACANRAPASLSDTNSISTRLATVSLVGLIEIAPHRLRQRRAERLPARPCSLAQRSGQRRREANGEHSRALRHLHPVRAIQRHVDVSTRLPLRQ